MEFRAGLFKSSRAEPLRERIDGEGMGTAARAGGIFHCDHYVE